MNASQTWRAIPDLRAVESALSPLQITFGAMITLQLAATVENSRPPSPPPQGASGYGFEYSVVDSTASWMHSRGEWSDGVSTHGAYHVQLPDGRVQRVSYTADEHGFRPVITYEEPHGYAGGFGWKVGGGSGLGKDVLEVDGLGAKEENGLGGRPHPGKDQVDVESRDVDEGHGGDIHPGEVYPGHGRGGRGHPRSDFVPVIYRQSYEPYSPYHDPPYYGSEPRRTYPSYRESPHAKVTHHGSPRGFPNHVGSPHHPRPAHDDPRHHVMHTTLKPRTYHINKTPAVGTRKPTNGHSKSHRLLTKEDKTPKGEMAGGHDPMEAHDMREEGHEVLTTLAPRLSMNDPIYRHDYSPMKCLAEDNQKRLRDKSVILSQPSSPHSPHRAMNLFYQLTPFL
ncbi:putative pro-resilin-like [Penaeus vannamei]|uniref:Putative pro-resilin-like n=1 Tax=Penaeus vannamei TaxID=6689 RepID=A0A423SB76_PENVA|nr:putative pro-resilin-like [Penaeus vannamei]